jgi:hypothetical protein
MPGSNMAEPNVVHVVYNAARNQAAVIDQEAVLCWFIDVVCLLQV